MQVHVEVDVGEVGRELVGEVDRQRCLAHPRSPGDRRDDHGARPSLGDHGPEPAELRLPAGEAGDVRWEPAIDATRLGLRGMLIPIVGMVVARSIVKTIFKRRR